MNFLYSLCYTIILFVFVGSNSAKANFIDYSENNNFSWTESYLVPNEYSMEKARPIFSNSKEGIYIGVGTERSFVGASLSKATHLLLADLDQDIITYNRMMIELLKYAESKEAFYHLRSNFNNMADLFSHYHNSPLSDESIYNFLKRYRGHKLFSNKNWFYMTDSLKRPDTIFWQNDMLYQKLRNMALQGKIQVIDIDFSKENQRQKLVKAIAEKNMEISIIDLSNAWQLGYIGSKTYRALADFLPVSSSQSLYLATWIQSGLWNPYHGFYLRKLISDSPFKEGQILGDAKINFNHCPYVLKGYD
ncbi:MAG: hypothetical protein VX583_10340 [Bdellovibrionota bacterium]|nr:hypothetical protein [Pseudobdellovibrionaceae bacterium]